MSGPCSPPSVKIASNIPKVSVQTPRAWAARIHGPSKAAQHPLGCVEQQADPREEAATGRSRRRRRHVSPASPTMCRPASPAPSPTCSRSPGQLLRPPGHFLRSEWTQEELVAQFGIHEEKDRGTALFSTPALHPASPSPQPHCGSHSTLTCY